MELHMMSFNNKPEKRPPSKHQVRMMFGNNLEIGIIFLEKLQKRDER